MSQNSKKIADITSLVVSSRPHFTRLVQDFFISIGGAKVEYVRNCSDAMLHLQQGGAADVVIAEYDANGDVFELAKHIRWAPHFFAPKLPIILIGSNWTPDRVQKSRNAGINEIVSFPISTHILMGRLLSAINSNRLFITIENYRGPDRRRATPAGYSGPLRRTSDLISDRLKAVAGKKDVKKEGFRLPPISIPVRPAYEPPKPTAPEPPDEKHPPFTPSVDFNAPNPSEANNKLGSPGVAPQRKADFVARPFPMGMPPEIHEKPNVKAPVPLPDSSMVDDSTLSSEHKDEAEARVAPLSSPVAPEIPELAAGAAQSFPLLAEDPQPSPEQASVESLDEPNFQDDVIAEENSVIAENAREPEFQSRDDGTVRPLPPILPDTFAPPSAMPEPKAPPQFPPPKAVRDGVSSPKEEELGGGPPAQKPTHPANAPTAPERLSGGNPVQSERGKYREGVSPPPIPSPEQTSNGAQPAHPKSQAELLKLLMAKK